MTAIEKKLKEEVAHLEDRVREKDRQIERLKGTIRAMEQSTDIYGILLAAALQYGTMVSPITTELNLRKAQMQRTGEFDISTSEGPETLTVRVVHQKGMFADYD